MVPSRLEQLRSLLGPLASRGGLVVVCGLLWLGLAPAAEAGERTIRVKLHKVIWVNTGLQLRAGERYTLRAKAIGKGIHCHSHWIKDLGRGDETLWQGKEEIRRRKAIPNLRPCTLVGRIAGGAPFKVGHGATVRAQRTGNLEIGNNDYHNDLGNNFGEVEVSVVGSWRPATPAHGRQAAQAPMVRRPEEPNDSQPNVNYSRGVFVTSRILKPAGPHGIPGRQICFARLPDLTGIKEGWNYQYGAGRSKRFHQVYKAGSYVSVEYFGETGRLQSAGHWRNGQADGWFYSYDASGKKRQAYYVSGHRQSYEVYRKGRMIARRQYESGIPNGHQYDHDDDGSTILQIYVDGRYWSYSARMSGGRIGKGSYHGTSRNGWFYVYRGGKKTAEAYFSKDRSDDSGAAQIPIPVVPGPWPFLSKVSQCHAPSSGPAMPRRAGIRDPRSGTRKSAASSHGRQDDQARSSPTRQGGESPGTDHGSKGTRPAHATRVSRCTRWPKLATCLELAHRCRSGTTRPGEKDLCPQLPRTTFQESDRRALAQSRRAAHNRLKQRQDEVRKRRLAERKRRAEHLRQRKQRAERLRQAREERKARERERERQRRLAIARARRRKRQELRRRAAKRKARQEQRKKEAAEFHAQSAAMVAAGPSGGNALRASGYDFHLSLQGVLLGAPVAVISRKESDLSGVRTDEEAASAVSLGFGIDLEYWPWISRLLSFGFYGNAAGGLMAADNLAMSNLNIALGTRAFIGQHDGLSLVLALGWGWRAGSYEQEHHSDLGSFVSDTTIAGAGSRSHRRFAIGARICTAADERSEGFCSVALSALYVREGYGLAEPGRGFSFGVHWRRTLDVTLDLVLGHPTMGDLFGDGGAWILKAGRSFDSAGSY